MLRPGQDFSLGHELAAKTIETQPLAVGPRPKTRADARCFCRILPPARRHANGLMATGHLYGLAGHDEPSVSAFRATSKCPVHSVSPELCQLQGERLGLVLLQPDGVKISPILDTSG